MVKLGDAAPRPFRHRYVILAKDFEKAYKNVIKKDEDELGFYT